MESAIMQLMMFTIILVSSETNAEMAPMTKIRLWANKNCHHKRFEATGTTVCGCMCALNVKCSLTKSQAELCQQCKENTRQEVGFRRSLKNNTRTVLECPGEIGYRRYQQNGPCIKFYTSKYNWFDAKKTCESDHPRSHLAILDNEKKNLQVTKVGQRRNHRFSNGVWIGLYEDRQSSVYMWIDGSAIDFSYGELGCVFLFRRSGWTWANTKCSESMHFVCELA